MLIYSNAFSQYEDLGSPNEGNGRFDQREQKNTYNSDNFDTKYVIFL